jgi:predicted  nucleic acid-binding Zn-ribbon protein
LARQDSELLESYQSEVARLKKEEHAALQEREILASAMRPQLALRYEKSRDAKGGFGAAHIEATHCSGCHVELTEGQISRLRDSEQIGECPYCHRLLVVQN